MQRENSIVKHAGWSVPDWPANRPAASPANEITKQTNRFPNKPLIYNIAWKTVIYLLLSAVIHYLERLIDFWREMHEQRQAIITVLSLISGLT
jgi:hypothetical protein